jgi:hypothetical protein
MDQWNKLSVAYIAGDLPAFIGNWIVIGVVCLMIVVWGLVAGWRFWQGTRRFVAAFDKARAALKATPSRSVDFAAHYEQANNTLRDAQVIGPAWRDWAATLLTPSVENRPVQSTIRPGEYFGLDLLRECGINPRLHAAMPNLLVGVGLMLTFFGLIVALIAAGEIASPTVSATQRAEELQKLLNGASAKFATSLAGLLCSLLYTAWRGSRMQLAERAVHSFLAALEERVPLATSATLQSEANAILRESQSQLEIFNATLAASIGKAVDNALDTRLGDHIGPLREAIEGLVTTIGTQNQEALSQMLEDFLKRLDGGAKGELGAVAVSLQGTQAALGQLQVGLSAAADGLVSAAGRIGAQAGTEVAAALAQVSQQVETLVERLSEMDRQARSSSTATFEEAARGIAEAANGFRRAAGEMAGELRQAIASLVTTSGREAATANQKLSEQFSEMLEQLRAVGDAAREQGDLAGREAAQRLDAAATALRGAAEALKDAMGQGGTEAAARLVGAVEEVRGAMERIIGKAGSTMAGEGERAAQRQQEGVERLTALLADAAARLRDGAGDAARSLEEGGRKAGTSLEQGGASASTGINGASELLRQGADAASRSLVAGGEALMGQSRDVAVRLGELQKAAETLREAVMAMSQDARAAGEPLRAAAQHWEATGKAAVTATAQLEGAAQQASAAGQGVQAAAARMQEAIVAVQTLARGLEATTEGFGGVGGELDATLKALQAGLQGFAAQISTYAKSTSDHMATGVTELAASIEELKEILPELIVQLRQTIADVKVGSRQ